MTLRQKRCYYCKKIYTYDDGKMSKGLSNRTEAQKKQEQGHGVTVSARCPVCIDPHAILGQTYRKDSILSLFRKYLRSINVDPTYFDNDTILSMMAEHPKMLSLYESNGSYKTVTLHQGVCFEGKNGMFMLDEALLNNKTKGSPIPYFNRRVIVCMRCGRRSIYRRKSVLILFLGLKLKCCKKCDNPTPQKERKEFIRNTKGLNRNGRPKSEDSERAKAKILNISRMDLHRHPHWNERVPALPVDTKLGTLVIKRVYWDEKTMTPKYDLVCTECRQFFTCVQKRVNDLLHTEEQCIALRT